MDVGESFDNAVRSFVEDQGGVFVLEGFEGVNALPGFGREETGKVKRVGGQAGRRQCGQGGRRARDWVHGDTSVDGRMH